MDNRLIVGEIRYANCTPIYMKLKESAHADGYRFIIGEPAELNAMLADGRVDVSSSSSIEYARHTDDYLVVPEVSISSTGEVGSILLFSKRPIEKLGGRLISVSSASATSTVMLKVLLKDAYGLDARFEPRAPELSGMLEGAEAALVIGDEALKERMALVESDLLVYDLGGIWQERYGLPFVYGLWMMRSDSAKSKPGPARRFAEDISLARNAACSDYESVAKRAPESAWMGVPGLVDYWSKMSYRLDEEHVRGVLRFYELAHRLDECPAVGRLEFL